MFSARAKLYIKQHFLRRKVTRVFHGKSKVPEIEQKYWKVNKQPNAEPSSTAVSVLIVFQAQRSQTDNFPHFSRKENAT